MVLDGQASTHFPGHSNQHKFAEEVLQDVGNPSGRCSFCHMKLGDDGFIKDHRRAVGVDGKYDMKGCVWCHEVEEG